VVLGLAPAVLFITGTIMWWNRVLQPALRKRKRSETAADPAGTAPSSDLPEIGMEA